MLSYASNHSKLLIHPQFEPSDIRTTGVISIPFNLLWQIQLAFKVSL